MAGGKKRVETIPAAWIHLIGPRVEAGRRLKQIAAEVLAINAELLVLARHQRLPATPAHPDSSVR